MSFSESILTTYRVMLQFSPLLSSDDVIAIMNGNMITVILDTTCKKGCKKIKRANKLNITCASQ
jgi:hypothetical protein